MHEILQNIAPCTTGIEARKLNFVLGRSGCSGPKYDDYVCYLYSKHEKMP